MKFYPLYDRAIELLYTRPGDITTIGREIGISHFQLYRLMNPNMRPKFETLENIGRGLDVIPLIISNNTHHFILQKNLGVAVSALLRMQRQELGLSMLEVDEITGKSRNCYRPTESTPPTNSRVVETYKDVLQFQVSYLVPEAEIDNLDTVLASS